MKILKVKFKNIHSLQGEHCVDFQDKCFTQSPIFAITGPTGSGKSTILDAIVLGLYNQMPRLSKISANEIQKSGAIITRGKNDAYSQVTYECEKGIFTSEWEIRRKRTGLIDNVKMSLYDQNGTPLFQNKQDIPKANTQNIGLNYDQFVKSILLAQGDFALFLKVSKKERSTLLEQITGTEIYRIIGKQVFEKNKELRQEIKLLENYKEVILQKIIPTEEIEKHEIKLSENEQKLQHLRERKQFLEKQIETIEKRNQIVQKLTELEQKLTENQEKYRFFIENKGEKLEKHLKLEPFSQDLLLWKTYCEKIEELELFRNDKTSENEQLKKQRLHFLEEVSLFINENCDFENFYDKLLNFQKEILFLEEQRIQKTNDYKQCKFQIDTLLKYIDFQEINPQKIDLFKEKLLQKKHKNQSSISEYKKIISDSEIENFSEKIIVLKQRAKDLQNAERLSVEILQKQNELETKSVEKQEVEALLISLPNEVRISQMEVALQKEKVAKLRLEKEKNDLTKSLEAYRQKLSEGEACPLCGSKTHPYVSHYQEVTDEFAEKIILQEQLLQQSQKKLVSQENSLQIANETLIKLNGFILVTYENISELKSVFLEQFPEFSINENWSEKSYENQQKIENLEHYQKEKIVLEKIELILPLLEELQSILHEGLKLKELIASKIKDKKITDEVARYQRIWSDLQTKWTTNVQQLNDGVSELKKMISLKETIENQLNTKILEQGYVSLTETMKHRLSYEEGQTLQLEKQSLLDEKQILTGQKATLSENFEQIKSQISISASLEEISQEQQLLNVQILDIETQVFDLKLMLQNDNKDRAELASYQQKIDQKTEKNKAWRYLDSLIGDATGAKFNQFAQDLTLQQLIRLANKRLQKLSPRYLLSQPSENEDDSLIAIDKDMGNERRSVKTLSGGETFILSLSLALALSDLASNNLKINSLFIDEGFGTLDAETLDQTLDTLERLQQESDKTIGIISHIESLKERITTQIQVKPKGSGFSELRIVSM